MAETAGYRRFLGIPQSVAKVVQADQEAAADAMVPISTASQKTEIRAFLAAAVEEEVTMAVVRLEPKGRPVPSLLGQPRPGRESAIRRRRWRLLESRRIHRLQILLERVARMRQTATQAPAEQVRQRKAEQGPLAHLAFCQGTAAAAAEARPLAREATAATVLLTAAAASPVRPGLLLTL